jgi:hypothetical protein
MKKLSESLDEESKLELSIVSMRDALTTISDDYEMEISRHNHSNRCMVINIRGDDDRCFYNRRELGGQDNLSLIGLEKSSKGMKNTSNVIDLFLEGLNRSGIEHDRIRISIESLLIKIYIII